MRFLGFYSLWARLNSRSEAFTSPDPRSTTPRPPSSTARPPAASDVQPPAPHLSPSADARSLILHDLLDELRSANSTIRDLHNSLAEKEATIQNLGAELVMAREEKGEFALLWLG